MLRFFLVSFRTELIEMDNSSLIIYNIDIKRRDVGVLAENRPTKGSGFQENTPGRRCTM